MIGSERPKDLSLAIYERTITVLMLVVAAIHLIPISGFFGTQMLASLYAVDITNDNLEILMRHRAMLLGILGGIFVYAAFNRVIQPIAFVVAFVSIASFFALCFSVGDFNHAIRKVVIADIIATIALLGAIILYVVKADN